MQPSLADNVAAAARNMADKGAANSPTVEEVAEDVSWVVVQRRERGVEREDDPSPFQPRSPFSLHTTHTQQPAHPLPAASPPTLHSSSDSAVGDGAGGAGAIQIDEAMLADLLRCGLGGAAAGSPALPSAAQAATPAPLPGASSGREYTPHMSTAEAVRGGGCGGCSKARAHVPSPVVPASPRAGPVEAGTAPPSPTHRHHHPNPPSLAATSARLARRDATIASLRAALVEASAQAGAVEAARSAARAAAADAAAARRQRAELAAGVQTLRAAVATAKEAAAAAKAEVATAQAAARFAAAREATAAARAAGLEAKLGRRDEVLGRMHATLAALGGRVSALQRQQQQQQQQQQAAPRRPTREADGGGAAVESSSAAAVVARLESALVASRADVVEARAEAQAAQDRCAWLEGEVGAFKAAVAGHLATAGLSVPFRQ